MAGKPKPHVFLSHVREDAECVERLAADLEACGIETWLDRHKIKPGRRWHKAIEDAIRSGAFFVACFSRSYSARTRTYMNEELYIALEEVRLRPAETSWFIPVRLDDCEIPDLPIAPNVTVHSFQWLDMFPDWHRGVERLAGAMRPSPALVDEDVRSRPAGTVFRDIDEPWCPEMVVISPGEFMMGLPEAERQWAVAQDLPRAILECELPQHLVRIANSLAVARYPVTFEEYDRFARAIYRNPPEDEGWGRGRLPVVNVSWEDAKAYVTWLSAEMGRPYRLLSEAEWEYACRAGTKTRFSSGDGIAPPDANYGENIGKTTAVGSYPPNPWGLFDMHGNVWEWVEDCWNDSYKGAPSDGSAWTGGDCSRRAFRGGAWWSDPLELRSAHRAWNEPEFQTPALGFRVAKTL